MSCKWRRLVETSEGHIGLAPGGAKPGEPRTDALAILLFLSPTNAAHFWESGDCVAVLLGSPCPLSRL